MSFRPIIGSLVLLCLSMISITACESDDDDNDSADDDAANDDTADDDAVDDDVADDDTADDDTADDDTTDDDTADDDTASGFVVLTQFTGTSDHLARVDVPSGAWLTLVEMENHLNIFPAVSPDGQTVVFNSNMHDPDPGVVFATMNYLMPAAGGEPQLLSDEDWHLVDEKVPVFSPDGTYIAYTRSHLSEPPAAMERIWFINVDGSDPHALYPGDFESRNDSDPAFSPDDETLAYWSDGDIFCGDIYLADLTAEPRTRVRLTYSNLLDVTTNYSPFFDATGEWVYFESSRNDGYGLYRVPIGGGEPQLVWDIGFSNTEPYIGAANYSQFRPASDYIGMVGVGVVNGTEQIVTFTNIAPVGDSSAVTTADLDCFNPYWWKPLAR